MILTLLLKKARGNGKISAEHFIFLSFPAAGEAQKMTIFLAYLLCFTTIFEKGKAPLNKYKKLAANTMIFAIGTFSSKLLVFFLMPFYTRILSSSEYGTVDIIVQTANLLIPIASLGINNAVIRFALEKKSNKSEVFSIGLFAILGGFALTGVLSVFLERVELLKGYTWLILLFVICSNLNTLCIYFIRSIGYSRLYALDGILRTILMILLNILFLAVFKLGVTGYVLASVLSDAISVVFLFFFMRLDRYVSLRAISKICAKDMLLYSLPLIPTTVCNWVVSLSDRYVITYVLGTAENGLYAVANKIPTVMVIIAGIFSDAWQISAVKEEGGGDLARFYSKVFHAYQAVAFTASSYLIITAKLTTTLLAAPSYYISWRYIPFLVVATTISCFSSFLGSVYMVYKKSGYTLWTMVAGALANIALNLLWIPKYGVQGAIAATLAAYVLMFFVRAVTSRRFIRIRYRMGPLVLNTLIVTAQSFIMIFEVPYWLPIEIGLTLLITLVNLPSLFGMARKVLRRG